MISGSMNGLCRFSRIQYRGIRVEYCQSWFSVICLTPVTGRMFTYEGQDHEVAPKAVLAEEILRIVFGGT